MNSIINKYCYAEIDDGIVFGVKEVSEPIINERHIEIPDFDTSLLGKLYQNGDFIDLSYCVQLDDDGFVIKILNYPANRPRPRTWVNVVEVEHSAIPTIGMKYESGKFRSKEDIESENRLVGKIIKALQGS